jgi:hypothetical protein
MIRHLSLLRPIAAASAVLVLGSATPAFAASSSPATAGPDPSPGASSPAPTPDPYPGVTTHVALAPRPVVTAPVAATRRPTTPAHHAVRAAHHTVTKHVVPLPARMRRPEPPAPSLGNRIFGAVKNAPRVPTGAALAVALLVLVSGAFLARVAREAAR